MTELKKKAYDPKELVEVAKKEGLELAEASAVVVIKSLFTWLEESAKLSETPYDDMILVLYPKLKELALEQADKIDGEEG